MTVPTVTCACGATRPNRRAEAKAKTRAQILLAAYALWAEPGTYDAVGMRDIATVAGVSTGAIFANWKTKADLWREVMGYEPPVDGPEVRAALQAAQAEKRWAA